MVQHDLAALCLNTEDAADRQKEKEKPCGWPFPQVRD